MTNVVDQQPTPIIDPDIAPLVRVMNDTGLIRTVFSCEGHLFKTDRPYIAYYASMAAGQAFARMLREDSDSPKPTLIYFWDNSPGFDMDLQIRFRLSSPQLNEALFWNKRHVRYDFDVMACMVQRLSQQFSPEEYPIPTYPLLPTS